MNQQENDVRLTIDEISVDRDGRRIATLVADDGSLATIPLELLPEGASVNQVVIAGFRLDRESTEQRAKRVRSLQHRLFNRETRS